MDVDANLTMATRFKTSAREEGKYKGRLVFAATAPIPGRY